MDSTIAIIISIAVPTWIAILAFLTFWTERVEWVVIPAILMLLILIGMSTHNYLVTLPI